MTTKIEDSSTATKNAIRQIVNGDNVITVGANGNYSTIDLALAYLATVTGMTQVAGTTGSITATKDSDTFVGAGTNFLTTVKAGDLITTSGDGIPPFVSTGIYFPIYGPVRNDTDLRIGTGYAGTTGSAKTYEIWRPERYTILLLQGLHSITTSIALPNGINVAIMGVSKLGCVLEGANTTTEPIKYGRGGMISISNVTLSRVPGGYQLLTQAGFVLDTSFIVFNIFEVELADYSSIVGNLFSIKGAVANIANITGFTFTGFGNISVDGLTVNNLNFVTSDGSADVCVFTDNITAGTSFSSTKQKIINGIGVERNISAIGGAGAIIEIQGLEPNRVVDATNITLKDYNQQASINPNCMAFDGGGTGVLNLRNSLIQPGNNAAGQGGITGGTAGDQIYMYGVYGDAGSAVITDGSATFTKVY